MDYFNNTLDEPIQGTIPLQTVLNLPLYMVLNAPPDHWSHRHPRFLTASMFIFDRQANRLRLKVDGEYTRSPRLCRQLFSDILTHRTITLKEFVWDHILQEPSSLVPIIHMELPLLTKVRLFTCWFRFTPQAYRLAYQDVHIRVLISFKKLLFATSGTANPIPMLEQFSTGLFINAFLLKSPFTIDCPKKWEIWTKVLHRFFPHHTFSAEMVYGVLRYLHVPCFVRKTSVFCSIIGTTHWQL
ncbi:hypothetical protein G6F36_013841 [Rhizopus arrhizus]|nr:hypothetical protein G6F36_013841 [Rhizopus arrhizus]